MATHDHSTSQHGASPSTPSLGEALSGRAARQVASVVEPKVTAADKVVLDRQDELMAKSAVDGRAPSHEWRTFGWVVLIVAGVGIALAALVAAFSTGSEGPTVLGALLIGGLVLLVGGAPVVFAGRSRARQQASARRLAEAESTQREAQTR